MNAKHRNPLSYGIMVVMILLLIGCAGEDLDVIQTRDVLATAYAYDIKMACEMNNTRFGTVYQKPEFQDVRDIQLCEVEFDIESIDELSDTALSVVYHVVYKPERRNINSVLKVWDEMENRLKQISPTKLPHPDFGMVEVYIDQADGTPFITLPDDEQGIENTRQWDQLSQVKESLETMAGERRMVGEKMYSKLVKEENNWIIHQDSVLNVTNGNK